MCGSDVMRDIRDSCYKTGFYVGFYFGILIGAAIGFVVRNMM